MPRPLPRRAATPWTHHQLARLPRRGGRPDARAAAAARGGVASLCAKRALRDAALRACGRRCVYCATALGADTATLDHVYPLSKGGPHVVGNVVAACGSCNRMKADMLPVEFFLQHPWAGANFVRYARTVHRALKRGARRAVSLACAA